MPTYYQARYKTMGVTGCLQTREDLLEEIGDFIEDMGNRPQMVIRITKISMRESEFEKLPNYCKEFGEGPSKS